MGYRNIKKNRGLYRGSDLLQCKLRVWNLSARWGWAEKQECVTPSRKWSLRVYDQRILAFSPGYCNKLARMLRYSLTYLLWNATVPHPAAATDTVDAIIQWFVEWFREEHWMPKAWNDLPLALQELTDTCTFKKQLKTHMFTLACTNLAFITLLKHHWSHLGRKWRTVM